MTVSVIISFSELGQLGMGTAIIKFVSSAYAKKEYDNITEYITTSFYLLFFSGSLVISILLFFKIQISTLLKVTNFLQGHGARLILSMGILAIFSFFVNTLRGVVAGVGRIDVCNYIFLLSRVLQVGIAVALLANGFDIWSLYFAYFAYFSIPCVIWWIFLRKCCAIKIFNYKRVNLSKGLELIKDGGTFAVGMAANFFLMPLNKIIIARYVGFSEVAYYEIGLRVVLAIRNIFFKGLEALLPKFGASHKVFLHYNEKVISVHKKGLKLVINFALPLFIMIFIFSTPLLKFWLGDKFNLQISVITKIQVYSLTFTLHPQWNYCLVI